MPVFMSLLALLILVLMQHILIIRMSLTSRRLRRKVLRSDEHRAYAEYLERLFLAEDQVPLTRREILGRNVL